MKSSQWTPLAGVSAPDRPHAASTTLRAFTFHRSTARAHTSSQRAHPDGGHPHFVMFRESFVLDPHLCIVMDLCEGGDMQKAIASQRTARSFFPEHRVKLWLLQLLAALDFLHWRRMMHRDIKPANIFLHHGACKLGDLGLSKEVQSLTVPLKHTQCGSPLYLSPEVHMGLPYSKTVDLWALGSTLFEMMVLEHAFQGRNDAEILGNVVWARYAEIKGNWSPHLVIMLKARQPRRRKSPRGRRPCRTRGPGFPTPGMH